MFGMPYIRATSNEEITAGMQRFEQAVKQVVNA